MIRAYLVVALIVGLLVLVCLAAYSVERWLDRREKRDGGE